MSCCGKTALPCCQSGHTVSLRFQQPVHLHGIALFAFRESAVLFSDPFQASASFFRVRFEQVNMPCWWARAMQ